MEERIQNIEQELKAIRERNARVETDKAWETSTIRTTVLAVITFVVTALALFVVKNLNPFRDALIATVGFVFSTLSLSFLKQRWLEHRNNE